MTAYVYGKAILEVSAFAIYMIAYYLSLAVTWKVIHWYTHYRLRSYGLLLQKALDSLEDLDEFMWHLELGMRDVNGTVIKEV